MLCVISLCTFLNLKEVHNVINDTVNDIVLTVKNVDEIPSTVDR